jgi:uncharacterized membrane protein
MDFLAKIWTTILIGILISLSVWGIYYVDELNLKISIFGIVAAIVAAFTSVLTVNINNKKAREREYQFHILKEKQKVCEHFYNAYFEMLFQIRKGKGGPTNKAYEETMLFKKGLMNWGSEQLIKEFIDYESKLVTTTDDPMFLLTQGNEFLKELRKELGFKDSGKINIMSIILNAEARHELKDKL